MAITLYGISNCDKIRKVRSWLKEHNIDYRFHDYKKDGCDEFLAQKILNHINFQEVINTRGTTWRKLPYAIKTSLDEKKAEYLMRDNPSIIKRPLIKINNKWIIGFDIPALTKMLNCHPHS